MDLFPTVTPTVIEDVDIVVPPEIDRLVNVFKSKKLKDIQHEIQSPGNPNRKKIGNKIADLTVQTRQDLKKKGVLQVTGRQLYVVGGVVRDWLINRFHGIAYPPDDWDLATDASVESLKLIVKTGIEERLLPDNTTISVSNKKFGNVQITISGKTFDITTFPFAGYADAPRMYLDSLKRNFNINSLYFSIDEKKIYDYHAGIADIHRRNPKFIGKAKQKLKDDPIYPLVYARLHARMSTKDPEYQEIRNELRKSILPYDVDRKKIYEELHKGIKQSLDRGKYFKILQDMGMLRQIFPSLKLNLHAEFGDMSLFPQVMAQLLQPNWNNLGHLSEILRHLEFNPRESHDILFLLKLPHYQNEESLKADRFHTGLSEHAIEQYLKLNRLRNSQWILSVIKNKNKL